MTKNLTGIRCNSVTRKLSTLLAVWLLSACGTHTYHIVKPGETLYAIGWWYGLDYRTLAQWNGIASPYILSPGDKILLTRATSHRRTVSTPESADSRPATPAYGAHTATPPSTNEPRTAQVNVVVRPLGKTSTSAGSNPVHGGNGAQPIKWQWPVHGRLLQSFSNTDQFKKGIKVAGTEGQEIYTAAPGKVVYTGNALLGYGNLVIVKHDTEFLSAYGHVRKLLVREGDYIRAGQQIAEMGSSGTNRNMLHFEIRRGGQPVDPLQFLPADNLVN